MIGRPGCLLIILCAGGIAHKRQPPPPAAAACGAPQVAKWSFTNRMGTLMLQSGELPTQARLEYLQKVIARCREETVAMDIEQRGMKPEVRRSNCSAQGHQGWGGRLQEDNKAAQLCHPLLLILNPPATPPPKQDVGAAQRDSMGLRVALSVGELPKDHYQVGENALPRRTVEVHHPSTNHLHELLPEPACARPSADLARPSPRSPQALFDAGARRYLLRIETSNPDLYSVRPTAQYRSLAGLRIVVASTGIDWLRQLTPHTPPNMFVPQALHPSSMSWENRMRCLEDLQVVGFQVRRSSACKRLDTRSNRVSPMRGVLLAEEAVCTMTQPRPCTAAHSSPNCVNLPPKIAAGHRLHGGPARADAV